MQKILLEPNTVSKKRTVELIRIDEAVALSHYIEKALASLLLLSVVELSKRKRGTCSLSLTHSEAVAKETKIVDWEDWNHILFNVVGYNVEISKSCDKKKQIKLFIYKSYTLLWLKLCSRSGTFKLKRGLICRFLASGSCTGMSWITAWNARVGNIGLHGHIESLHKTSDVEILAGSKVPIKWKEKLYEACALSVVVRNISFKFVHKIGGLCMLSEVLLDMGMTLDLTAAVDLDDSSSSKPIR